MTPRAEATEDSSDEKPVQLQGKVRVQFLTPLRPSRQLPRAALKEQFREQHAEANEADEGVSALHRRGKRISRGAEARVGAGADLVVGDPLLFVGPFAGELEPRLDGLGARVHGQHAVIPEEARHDARKLGEAVVVEGARGQRAALRLLHQGLQDLGVPVALHAHDMGGTRPARKRRGQGKGEGAQVLGQSISACELLANEDAESAPPQLRPSSAVALTWLTAE